MIRVIRPQRPHRGSWVERFARPLPCRPKSPPTIFHAPDCGCPRPPRDLGEALAEALNVHPALRVFEPADIRWLAEHWQRGKTVVK